MTSLLQVQFQGVEEGADPKNLPPGTLLRADNCAMDKGRRLCKRAGTTGLVKTAISGSNIAAGARLVTQGTDLAVTDGQTVWTYVPSLSKWNPVDRAPHWHVTRSVLVDTTRSALDVDIGISGDLIVSFYYTALSNLYVRIDGLSTGQTVMPPLRVGTGARPKVLINGTAAILVYATATTIDYQVLSLTTLAVTASGSLVTNSLAYGIFDVTIGTPTAGVATLYLAYELAAGVSRMRIASFTLSTFAAVATLSSIGTNLRCVCIVFGTLSQRVTVAFSSYVSLASASTEITSCTTALASQVGPTMLQADHSDYVLVAEDDVTNVLVGWVLNPGGDGTGPNKLTTALYSVAAHAQVATSERITYGLFAASKPWRTAGRWYTCGLARVHPDTYPSANALPLPSSVVVEIETVASLTGNQDATHPHVATLENQTGWFAWGGGQSQAATDSDGNVYVAAMYRNAEPYGYSATPVVPTGVSLFRLSASAGDTFGRTYLGASALLAGGAPVWFDGASTMPYGFVHAPQIISVGATLGATLTAGTYSYIATYAWRDANGLLHRSTPSPPVSGTTSGGNLALNVVIASASISPKLRTLTAATESSPVIIELWRTVRGGVGPHYKRTIEPSAYTIINDPRAASVTFLDEFPDSDINTSPTPAIPLATQPQLYTELGELENVPPPSLVTVATHKNRLVGLAGDLHTVWFSKDSTNDLTQAPGFNEALTLSFAAEKTALASLDAVLVVFGADDIDVVHGEGPDDTGSGNWTIQGLQTDVGCVNPRSVVTTPMGVVFESARGLELLSRGLEVAWVGQSVDDTLAAYPTITSAVLVAEEQEVRFTCDNGSTGIVLVWDYSYKIWFVRRYNDAADTLADNIRFADAALIDGVYTLLTAGGQVYRETAAHKLDNGTDYVERDILLAPISAQPGRSGWANANLGWSRVKDITLLGTSLTNHDLKVSVAHDYSASYAYTETFLAGSTATTVGPLEKCRVSPATQKCQAVQVRIQDLTPTSPGTYPLSTGDGPIIEAIALRIGALDGPAKTSAGQQG